MKSLNHTDRYTLDAAANWLVQGNLVEAAEELNQLSPSAHQHPDALEIIWRVCAAKKEWDTACGIAKTLTERAPDQESGWLHLAYARRRVSGGSIEESFAILCSIAKQFPESPTIFYNIACYASALGKSNLAFHWFQKAFSFGDTAALKLTELDDEVLEPLWPPSLQIG